ncbi:hypothetical protein DdX_09642 [Ditylenchus destructor]|uniref:Uncharacterized protein n=1 Tax=Ditylenchus destructor TaxID=166010 RepID=A0AAD4N2D7_9BILA|nr:hypothetical protein DdX_09642 [Ditylenchus destructor]
MKIFAFILVLLMIIGFTMAGEQKSKNQHIVDAGRVKRNPIYTPTSSNKRPQGTISRVKRDPFNGSQLDQVVRYQAQKNKG